MTGHAAAGKLATRQRLLAHRDRLGVDERHAKSLAICAAAHALLAARAPHTVALYAPKGSEVDTAMLDATLRAAGVHIVYPRVVDHQRVLAFHTAAIGELVAGRYGLREPADHAPNVALADIAAFVVPGIAFDRQGGRIGWGKGHYDATLASASGLTIGLGFEVQLVERLPRERHDAVLDAIVTDVATYTRA
jgi:5-formyltetrahydrofolate cyclo-ligase